MYLCILFLIMTWILFIKKIIIIIWQQLIIPNCSNCSDQAAVQVKRGRHQEADRYGRQPCSSTQQILSLTHTTTNRVMHTHIYVHVHTHTNTRHSKHIKPSPRLPKWITRGNMITDAPIDCRPPNMTGSQRERREGERCDFGMLTVLEEHQNKENRKRWEGAVSNAKINHI